VIKKLGWGHFSTVWMVKDRKAASAGKPLHFFALKVQKSAEHYTEAAMDEVELLDCISTERNKCEEVVAKGGKDADGVSVSDVFDFSQYVATLHDSFFHTGPNGRHMCMVFSMLGCNLLSVIKAYNYRGVPIPVVKNMVKGICKGLDFLHRKCHIIHTDLKPENVLLLYEGGSDKDEEDLSKVVASMSIKDKEQTPLGQSIAELEIAIQNPKLSQDERKKLRRRLKKKRQKERKRGGASTPDGGGDSEGSSGSDDDETADDETDQEATKKEESSSFLSDWEMSKILSRAANMITSPVGTEMGILPSTPNRVKRRLSHSSFVTSNFGHRQECADAKLMEVLRETVVIKTPSAEEFEANFKAAESSGGVAEVAFMLRAFTPEEELADGLSASLGGIPWIVKSGSDSSREW
jgi:serine/threonine protein kinase